MIPTSPSGRSPHLLAVSDLHIAYQESRQMLEGMRPRSSGDWLLVAGDVAARAADVESALRLLRDRFAVVVWAPGNHELWTPHHDQIQLRGRARYEYLVKVCHDLEVITPEDPYPIWDGPGGPGAIAPLFVLYDYTFHPPNTSTKEQGLALAYDTGVVCTDEVLLHPDPYPSREAWCAAWLVQTRQRLEVRPEPLPTVLVNHFPLVCKHTKALYYQPFAQWCGIVHIAGWHSRYNAAAVVYGHLHIPGTRWHHGVRFEEVSLGYPREWGRRGNARTQSGRSCRIR